MPVGGTLSTHSTRAVRSQPWSQPHTHRVLAQAHTVGSRARQTWFVRASTCSFTPMCSARRSRPSLTVTVHWRGKQSVRVVSSHGKQRACQRNACSRQAAQSATRRPLPARARTSTSKHTQSAEIQAMRSCGHAAVVVRHEAALPLGLAPARGERTRGGSAGPGFTTSLPAAPPPARTQCWVQLWQLWRAAGPRGGAYARVRACGSPSTRLS